MPCAAAAAAAAPVNIAVSTEAADEALCATDTDVPAAASSSPTDCIEGYHFDQLVSDLVDDDDAGVDDAGAAADAARTMSVVGIWGFRHRSPPQHGRIQI